MCSETELRANPGGRLDPSQVVGRDPFIEGIWTTLEQQSVLLTAERRMGKTSVLNKMVAEPPLHAHPIKKSLQGIGSAEEFARSLVEEVNGSLPGIGNTSLMERIRNAGIKSVGVSGLQVEFDPKTDGSWKDVATETFSVLQHEVDVTVVLLWDELPHMVSNIHRGQGASAAREVLDVLRATRETHSTVRMVFSGSIGIHHVIEELREQGGMWAPTHDMLTMDLPPLSVGDAKYLAAELLGNESVACDDLEAVAIAIADRVDCTPYYVHHIVHTLMIRQREGPCDTVDVELVDAVVDGSLQDPLDPWQLGHYIDRVSSYYGPNSDSVRAILDVVATAEGGATLETVGERIGALTDSPPPTERLHDLLRLLCKDHYLGIDDGRYRFRLELVRRAWLGRRPRRR